MVKKGYIVISYDVMLEGVFQATLSYEYCPLFPIDLKDIISHTEEMLRSMKGKQYNIVFNEK